MHECRAKKEVTMDIKENEKKVVIVVADDNEIWLRQLTEALKKIENIEIIPTKDGKEELECIEKSNPDIVITDIEMPQMTGVEVIEKVKEYENVPEFIVITGGASTNIMQQLYKLPVAEICFKPVDTEKIIEKIQKMLEERQINNEIDNIGEEAEDNSLIPVEKISIWQRIKRFFTKKYSK